MEVKFENTVVQTVFMIVPGLSRTCIIGMDLLEKMKTVIDLSQHKLTFQNLEGNPSIKLYKDEETLENKENNEINQISDLSIINPNWTREEMHDQVKQMNLKDDRLKSQLVDILWEYRGVFRREPGRLKGYYHELKLKGDQTFIGRSYPIPIFYRDQVQKQIDHMLLSEIIQKSNSSYINPLVPVIKKDGTVRVCLDARRLNERLIEDWECPETAEVLFQGCQGVKIISALDLTSSFWQIPLHPDSKKYTAFQHRGNTYEFNVVPFGLKTSTAALVRGLEQALQGIGDYVIKFVDDMLIKSSSEEEHLEHIKKLLVVTNLTINLEKCKFFQEQVKFLGFILSTEGIRPDPEKIQGIQNFPAPRNIKQLKGFLGLVNFYTRFSEKHAEAIVPLLYLLKKGNKWQWTEKEQKYFKNIKDLFGKKFY